MSAVVGVDDVRAVVVETLGLTGTEAELTADTALLGGVTGLDSMGVLELLTALERRFGIEIDDEDVTAEIFETVGTLSAYVESKAR